MNVVQISGIGGLGERGHQPARLVAPILLFQEIAVSRKLQLQLQPSRIDLGFVGPQNHRQGVRHIAPKVYYYQ
jgi:hypothetical protein